MPTGASILNKINKALNKVTPVNRIMYKRIATITGDALIGRTTVTNVDTLLSPQPSIAQAGREHLSGARDAVETVISPNGTRLVRDDYVITMSSTAVTTADLENKDMFFVFKDGINEDCLYIMDYSPIEYQGVVIVYTVYARSVKTS